MFYPPAELPHHGRQAPVACRYQGFQFNPQQPGQDRRGPARGYGDLHRVPVNHGGHDETAQGGIVDHVDRHVVRLGGLRNPDIDLFVGRGSDRQRTTDHVIRHERPGLAC